MEAFISLAIVVSGMVSIIIAGLGIPVVSAINRQWGWAIGCLLFPPASILYAFFYWKNAKTPVIFFLIMLGLTVGLFLINALIKTAA